MKLSLGIFIPVYTRTQVNKKEREKLEALKNAKNEDTGAPAQTEAAVHAASTTMTGNTTAAKATPFKAFFNS